jgi:hypothetical protein
MPSDAFESAFEVKTLQRDATALYAYGSPYSSFESVLVEAQADKPVLRSLTELSRALLRRKNESEKAK